MIIFNAVTKTFPSRDRAVPDVVAVNETSFRITEGKITALVGPSGSGKTTLLRMVNRMVEPTSGTVTVDGTDVAKTEPVSLRRRIGYVMQNAGLLPHRTIAQNIATVPHLKKTSREEIRRIVAEMMELVGLDESMASRYPAELSGGQAQRVGVARALAGRPSLLLMDEPFGAVDPVVRAGLQDQLGDIHAQTGATIVLVTHDMAEAFRLAHDVVVLGDAGGVVQQGSPTELMHHPASEKVARFLQLPTGEAALSTISTPQGTVVTDARGIPLGLLDDVDPR